MENDENKMKNPAEPQDSDEKQDEINQENASLEAGIVPSLVDTEIVNEVQTAFLDYAMSVIVSRAIPDVRDGLKPVHRRVIFGMSDGGYTPDKPFVKSAKIVGDVMGKYHPHGDSAIYMTLVRLAQPFSMRYCLVQGHGNFGSMDGDDPAAMRYTESRMSKLAIEMVKDINADTVDFMPNYDGSLEEPTVLPSRFPNLLVNGSDGIAVGMATKMPPHNLSEVIEGVKMVASKPDCTVEDLMTVIKGPDFPTGGIIYGLSGIKDAYTKGRGTFRLRGKTEIIEEENGKSKIIIREIPYQVNKANLVAKIGELARDKVIDGITSVKDFSKTDVNIQVECRRDVVPQVILNQLFKNTQLEVSYGIINLCIDEGTPRVLGLKDLLVKYLNFQVQVIERRTKFYKAKDEARKHIVEGLLKVHDILDVRKEGGKESRDEFIDLATGSANPNEFAEKLMARYGFSEAQAKAVVQMTLGRLTGLETQKLEDEKAQLEANIANYNFILSSRENMQDVVIKELEEINEKFGDERKSVISNNILSIEDEDLIPEDNLVITLTEKGYIKRMSTSEFRAQKRGGMGVKGMSVYNDDEVVKTIFSKTHLDILFFTSKGRVYRKRGHEIPEYGRTGKGIPVLNLLNLEKDEKVVSIINVEEYENHYLFFATVEGLVKRTTLEEFIRINCNGKFAITFKEGDSLLDVKVTNGNTKILLASYRGKLCMFDENEVRPSGRTSMGVRGIKLAEDDRLVDLSTDQYGKQVFTLSELGLGKISNIEDYRLTKRGAGGVITIKITEKTGNVVGMKVISGEEDFIVITNNGQIIRSEVSQVRVCGRNSSGVKIINLKPKEKVTSFTLLPHEEEDKEEVTTENPAENSVETPVENEATEEANNESENSESNE